MTCRTSDMGRSRPDHQRMPTYSFISASCVLGSSCFTLGCHWEVEVGGTLEWAVGIFRESAYLEGPFLVSLDLGFWVVGLQGDMKSCQHRNRDCFTISTQTCWSEDFPGLWPECYFIFQCHWWFSFIHLHKYMYLGISVSTLFYPEIQKEGKNVQPIKICDKEATDVAFRPLTWPFPRRYVISVQEKGVFGVKLMDYTLSSSSDITRSFYGWGNNPICFTVKGALA